MKKLLFFLIFLVGSCADAGIEQDMYRTLARLGVGANFNPIDVVKGQEGPFFNAGGAMVAAPSEYIEFINISPPRFGVGYCNIDLHFGGISFVSSEKMLKMGKAIVSDALVYASTLALKQLSPTISNQIESLQQMANKIAQWTTDSCTAARFITDNIASKLGAAQKSVSQKKLVLDRKHKNHQKAEEEMNKPGKKKEALEAVEKDPKLSKELFVNKNLAWASIEESPMLKGLSKETKFLLMSISGTIVVRASKGEGDPTVETYPSLLLEKKDTLIAELLGMGKQNNTIQLYTCSAKKCLNITQPIAVKFGIQDDGKKKIQNGDTFSARIKKMIARIEQKILHDVALATAELDFIAKIRIPIKKLIRSELAFNRGVTLSNGAKMSFVHEYRDAIAIDLLYEYLNTHINKVRAAIKSDIIPDKLDKKYSKMLDNAERALREIRNQYMADIGKVNHAKNLIQFQDKRLKDYYSTEIFGRMGNRLEQGS